MADAFDFITEKGEKDFDRAIKSEGKDRKKIKKEGTRARPFNPGVFQEVKDIDWGSGQFTYAGGTQSDNPNASICQSGWSEEGLNWFGNASFSIAGPSNISVSIRGNDNDSMVIFAGGFSFVQTRTDDNGNPRGFLQPILCSSFDDGKSWQGVSCPSEAHNLKDGSVQSVGYDPKTKLFYVGVSYREEFTGPPISFTFTHIAFAGTPGSGFEQEIFRTSQTAAKAFPFPPYPQKMKLCEAPFFFGGGGTPLLSTRADIRYVSSNGSAQVLQIPDGNGEGKTKEISLADVPSTADFFPVSLCVGNGIMVVVYTPFEVLADGDSVLGELSGASTVSGTVSFS